MINYDYFPHFRPHLLVRLIVKTVEFVGNCWCRLHLQTTSNEQQLGSTPPCMTSAEKPIDEVHVSEKRKSTTVICINRTSVGRFGGERRVRDVSVGLRRSRTSGPEESLGSPTSSCASMILICIYILIIIIPSASYALPSCSSCIILSSLE